MKKGVLLLCLTIVFFAVAQAKMPVGDSTLQQFVGKYKFPDGSVVAEVTVALEDGALTMTSSAGTSALEKQSDDLYTIVQFQGTAKFNRDTNKKIIGVSINAMGYQLEGTKTENATTKNFVPLLIQLNTH
ncbi:MAG: hypothetical protein V4450_07590 [Bacteroidota bacterium]